MSINDDILKSHDVVIGILSFLPEYTNRISNSSFHIAIYEIKKRNPELFKGLPFATNASNPYSEDLEQILATLALCGLLSRNGNWRWNLRGIKNYFNNSLRKKFIANELEIIDREGKLFAEKVEQGELDPHKS
ncbi:MAG: hypothetical protein Q7K11_00475 [Candidatus Berkelbacteria bacterium]|nr:hypothetical protein [Candidatus Berkelbacteria bacterium]